MRAWGLALVLALAPACASRKVDVTLGGRPTESLQGRATRAEGLWTVDLDLPLGDWVVDLPEEGLTARVLVEGGRPHARWEVTGERLLARPFRVRLRPASGEGTLIWMEVRGRFVGQGLAAFVANLLGGPIH